MSKEEMEKIIKKAMEDEEFRNLLLDDPQKACEGYEITEEDFEQLVNSLKETFAGELDVRISKKGLGGKFMGFTGPMGIDGIIE